MKRFKNILYVCEYSVDQDSAITRAVTLAQNNQARLTLVDSIGEQAAAIGMPSGGLTTDGLKDPLISDRRQKLESLVAPYQQHLDIDIEILVGRRFLEVIRAVLRHDYDLVIKPAENPDWIERLFGSDDMHLLRKCPCPVWLMKAREKSNYESILAAIDLDLYSPESGTQKMNKLILGLAASLSISDFAQLHLVHAWDSPEAGFLSIWADDPDKTERNMTEGERVRRKNGMEAQTRSFRENIGAEAYAHLSPKVHLIKGSAARVIPDQVKRLKADLVVMGTAAHTGIPGFIIGNTAETILDQLQCSVLAIKPPGFVTPVTLGERLNG